MITLILLILVLLVLGFVGYRYFTLKQAVTKLTIAAKRATVKSPDLPTQLPELSAITQSLNQLTTELTHNNQQLTEQTQLLTTEKQQLKVQNRQAQLALGRAIENLVADAKQQLTKAKTDLTFVEQDHYAKQLQAELAVITDKLADLELYQQLTTGTFHSEKQTVDLTKLLKDTLVSYYDQLQTQQFRLAMQMTNNVVLTSDSIALKRIITESLDNVLAHGQSEVRVNLTKDGDYAQLLIQSQSLQPIQETTQLTQPFYTEHTTSREQAAGLGLYFVAELVDVTAGKLMISYNEPVFTVQIRWKLV